MQVTYLCAVYSVFKDRRDDFCPSIGRQREGIFLDPLSKKIKKIFLDNKKAAAFNVKTAAKTEYIMLLVSKKLRSHNKLCDRNYLSAFSSQ